MNKVIARTGFAAVCLLSASATALAQAPSSLSIRGAGSSFAAPLYKQWVAAYRAENPGTVVSYDSVGSGEGVRRFLAGSVEFGASDQPLRAADEAKVGRGVVVVPATAGMVVIAYSLPGTTGELKLPRDVYVDIFAGRITAWNDPRLQAANPSLTLPRRSIALIARQDASGTTEAFTSHLSAVDPKWRTEGPGVGTLARWPSTALLARGNEGVSHLIKISEGAIGYVEYGFAKRLGLPMASLQNKAGAFVGPSEAAARLGLAEATTSASRAVTDPAGGEAYPIVTYSWLLLYRSYPAASAVAIRDFVAWGLGKGQGFGAALGYIPLPQGVAAAGVEALSAIR